MLVRAAASVESFRGPGTAGEVGVTVDRAPRGLLLPTRTAGELLPISAVERFHPHGKLTVWVSSPRDEGMPDVTEPQVWVLIGTFAATVLGGMTFSTNLIMGSLTKVITANTDRLEARLDAVRYETVAEIHVTRTRVDSVEAGLTAKIDTVEAGLTAKINTVEAGLSAKIDTVEAGLSAKIDSVESRLRGDLARIDADVTAIIRRIWNDPPAG